MKTLFHSVGILWVSASCLFRNQGKRIRASLQREIVEIQLTKVGHIATFIWRSGMGKRVLKCVIVTSRTFR